MAERMLPSWKGVVCKIAACEKKATKTGLCNNHYNEKRYRENPTTYTPEKLERHYANKIAKQEKSVGRPKPDKCEICLSAGGKLGIVYDHCHKTGRGRGWLCSNCNTALGFLNEDVSRILKLAEYAKRHTHV